MHHQYVACIAIAADASDGVSVYQETASLSMVTFIAAHRVAGSDTVDALTIKFANGEARTLGSLDAITGGSQIANITLGLTDKITGLAIWSNATAATVQGIYISTNTAILNAALGRSINQASLRLNQAGELGSGLLVGVASAAAEIMGRLSALAFVFAQRPSGASLAVDMPAIDIEGLRYLPKQVIQSSVGSSGGTVGTAKCAAHREIVTSKVEYSKAPEAQRLQQLIGSMATSVLAKTYRLATGLEWAAVQQISTSSNYSDNWSSQVYDIFDTTANGQVVSKTIEAPEATFTVSSGQEAKCNFVYGIVGLSIPYTLKATLFFGSSSWSLASAGVYEASSHTSLDLLVTFTAKAPGIKSGV
jgi:hypothetical protein